MPFRVVFEDDSIFIVDKPQGLATTPGKNPSLCEEVFALLPDLAVVKGYKPGEGGLLHRLDNETGGLVLFAKTGQAFRYYTLQMKEEKIIKHYTAVVTRKPPAESGIITVPIAHHFKSKKKMVVAAGRDTVPGSITRGSGARPVKYRGRPQPAQTQWRVIGPHEYGFLLKVTITKGVRHQIRVHLAYAGMPIAGDKLYYLRGEAETPELPRHLLYASGIEFSSFRGKQVNLKIPAAF